MDLLNITSALALRMYHVVFAAVPLDNYSAIFTKTRAWDRPKDSDDKTKANDEDDLKRSVLGIGEGTDDGMNR